MDMQTGLETKIARAGSGELQDDVMRAFEAFKEANDERLAAIEQRMSADVLTEEKVDRIGAALDRTKARLDELTLKARRPALAREEQAAPDERKVAFEAYVRKGETGALAALERKSMSIASDADGGYVVPTRRKPRSAACLARIRRSAPLPA